MIRRVLFIILVFPGLLSASSFETITFPSEDGIIITADLYIAHPDKAPFIILFHQAGWSRGEYREVAPKLNKLGFNCMAIDQRSGESIHGVDNETAIRAERAGKPTAYLDAYPDMKTAVAYAKAHFVKGQLIILGSSYSAALVLKLAGESPKGIDGVVAFSPGEYFERFGKSGTYITDSAKNIKVPVFITSAKSEKEQWFHIYQAIASEQKTYFLPRTQGRHGSRALWSSYKDHKAYWSAVTDFLKQFLPE